MEAKTISIRMLCLAVLALSALTSCSDSKTSAPPTGDVISKSDTPTVSPAVDDTPPIVKSAKDESAELIIEDEKPPSAESVYPDPKFTVTSEELSKARKQDRKAFAKKYEYKVIELSGRVVSYRSTFHSGFVLKLAGDPDNVAVTLAEETPWIDYPPGSNIVVRGKVKGLLEIEKAVVVESHAGDPIPEHSAKEIDEFAAEAEWPDKPGFRHYEWMRVKGTINKLENDTPDGTIYLGENGKDFVKLWPKGGAIANYDYRQCRDLKPGDEVVFLGDYSGIKDGLPVLSRVFLVSPLPKLPPQPIKQLRPDPNGRQKPFLIFTSDLLGEWFAADPQDLKRMIKRRSDKERIEITGEVVEVKTSEGASLGDIYVQLKNSSQVNLKCVANQKKVEQLDLKPGTTIIAHGVLWSFTEKECSIYVDINIKRR